MRYFFLFKPAIWEQTTRLLCATARCNKNRSFGECQAEGHWSRDVTTVSDYGTISDFSIISSFYFFSRRNGSSARLNDILGTPPGNRMGTDAQFAFCCGAANLSSAALWQLNENNCVRAHSGENNCNLFAAWKDFFFKSFNLHVLKRMEKMFGPFAHQDLHRSLNRPHIVQFYGKTNG